MRLSLLAPPATVTAAAVDLAARILPGVALPYGVQGSTSAGRVEVDAGAVRIPTDLRRVKLFTEHGRTTPVGYTLTADDGPDQLAMSFRVAATPAGDDALLEASEGVRDGLSVELDNVQIRAGHVTAADLVAVALTSIPAYADARLVASDTPDEDPAPAPDDAPAGDDEDDEEEEETMTTTAPAAPADETTEARAALPTAGALTAARGDSSGSLIRQLGAAFAAVDQGRATRDQLFAALADIKWSDGGGVAGAPSQLLADLWQGVAYQRKIVPNTAHTTDLNSMKVGGFVWSPAPVVAPYLGDKAAVPSNPAKLVWTDFPAVRLAGAHDVDRIYRDFNVPGFWESYWAAMTESYAMQSDQYVVDTIVADGTAAGLATDVWDAIVSGVVAVSPYAGLGQIKVAIAANQIGGLAAGTSQNVPALFSSVFSSLEDLVNATAPGVPDNTVLVWAQPAVSVKEAGATPIRVEAINLPNGGVDTGLFGYIAAYVTRAAAVQVYTLPAPTPGADDAAAAPAKRGK